MPNLYSEICDVCDINDIVYVLIENTKIDKDWFLEEAKGIEYDSGYGRQVINSELKIVLKDNSWLERHDYDGAEWFELKKVPIAKNDKIADRNRSILFEGE